jgi:hypothetical protein
MAAVGLMATYQDWFVDIMTTREPRKTRFGAFVACDARLFRVD